MGKYSVVTRYSTNPWLEPLANTCAFFHTDTHAGPQTLAYKLNKEAMIQKKKKHSAGWSLMFEKCWKSTFQTIFSFFFFSLFMQIQEYEKIWADLKHLDHLTKFKLALWKIRVGLFL